MKRGKKPKIIIAALPVDEEKEILICIQGNKSDLRLPFQEIKNGNPCGKTATKEMMLARMGFAGIAKEIATINAKLDGKKCTIYLFVFTIDKEQVRATTKVKTTNVDPATFYNSVNMSRFSQIVRNWMLSHYRKKISN